MKLAVRLCVTIFILFMGAMGLDYVFPIDVSRLNDHSLIVLDKDQHILSTLLANDGRWRLPIKKNQVDPLFIKMLITYEDKRFFFHPGVDPLALIRALVQCIRAGKIISGGSSLTMQTVRLLSPRPKTLKSKCIEILRALQLELHFTKDEILEFYLQLAPYGGNIEGIRAACLSYFGISAQHLRPSQAALLVVLPQSPNRLRPELATPKTKQYRDKVLTRMQAKGLLSQQQVQEAMEDQIPSQRQRLPRNAAHIAYALNRSSMVKQKNTFTSPKIYQSSLDSQLQIQIESVIKQNTPFLISDQSVAVLVVDNKTARVLAYIGSLDFWNDHCKGKIDMVRAIRSPGSLLKPFIYGMAFDAGILHPDTVILDAPLGFSGYRPSNFKDLFHGQVTLSDALKQSLNIPAVMVLDRLGSGKFASHLRHFNISLKFENNVQDTLPLALGGVGMTLWDLVSLYCALASQGEFKPLVLWGDQINTSKPDKKTRLMEPASAWHISRILEGSQAPEGFVDRALTPSSPIAYKTGTSYGYRDAWAIGYNDAYTVGVWVGKADGSSSAPETGRSAAAPILYKIFDLLPRSSKGIMLEKPEGLLSKSIELLPHLKQFKPRSRKNTERQDNNKPNESSEFQIRFPKEGSVIQLEKDPLQGFHPLNIHVSGGKPPYYCLINGRPQGAGHDTSRMQWIPEGPGFIDITVMDSQGHTVSSNVEFRPYP